MNAVLLTIALLGHPTVTDTAILTHGDPVPRFELHYPNVRVVAAETVYTLGEDTDLDVIAVFGRLRCERSAYNTRLRVKVILVYPGGVLDFGTPDDPVLANVEVIFADSPLRKGTLEQPDIDPFQIGGGLIVFGQWLSHGRPIERTWATTDELAAGATSVRVPTDWLPGDELLIPDTRQPLWGQLRAVPKIMGQKIPIRRESPVWLAEDRSLSKPLDFEHAAARAPDGTVRYLPYVANAGRNIVYRSENPQGTRGHTILLEMAHWDVRYSSFIGLGRTLATPLHSTTQSNGAVVQIGTNQVGRYPLHAHHVHGHADEHGITGRFIGNYVDGSDVSKWGLVIHGTHDCLVNWNVIDRCVGAGLVTEDGYEVRNVFDRNFVMGCKGAGGNVPLDAKASILAAIPGGEGSAGWMHGSANTVTNNVFCNSMSGLNFLHIGQVTGRSVPSAPGGPNDTPMNPQTSKPILCQGNVCFANAQFGFETWRLATDGDWTAKDTDAYHNGLSNVMLGFAEPTGITMDGLRILGQGGTINGFPSNSAYVFRATVRNSRIEGCDLGIGSARFDLTVEDTHLQNVRNIDLRGDEPRTSRTVQRVTSEQLPGFPYLGTVLSDGEPEELPPPPPPLTLEQRVERLEKAVFGP